MTDVACPVCNSNAKDITRQNIDGKKIDCPRCGVYSITGTAEVMWKANNPNPHQVANTSGWIREHQSINIIDSYIIDFLLSLETPSVETRAIKILTTLEKKVPSISGYCNVYLDLGGIGNLPDKNSLLKEQLFWLGISYCENSDELKYLIYEYLDKGSEFLKTNDQSAYLKVQITPKGHSYLAELKKTQVNSQIGFCAMWFNKDVLPIWTNAIQPAIVNAGYDAKRIDTHEHNNRIDDEIIAMIRRSKFMIADFTGQRGGVYFEAGFALGLGLQVIWTCEKSELENNHFDTRQYNFVTWEEGKLDEFKANLQNRIEATLGRGALS